jgi:hypothetical protein
MDSIGSGHTPGSVQGRESDQIYDHHFLKKESVRRVSGNKAVTNYRTPKIRGCQ